MITANIENINTWISQINTEYKIAVSVDCVIFGYGDSGLCVLLINCNMPPYNGKLSLIGDLARPEEELDDAAKRILTRYTGMENIFQEQVQTFSKVNRHPLGRVITVAYYSLLQLDNLKIYDVENKQLQWVCMDEVETLAFDHNLILETCLIRLRKTLRQQAVGFSLLPQKFTLNQLRCLYEIVLGIRLDKRNFRRKLHALNLLIDLNETQKSVAHRPAKLYSFDIDKYASLKNKGFKFEI